MANGWNGPAPPGVVFHYRPGRKGEYAAEILSGFNGTIQVDAYGAYTHLATLRRPAMNRRNALFAGHDEGGRNWARFASLIGTCKMNGIEPYAYLRDLFTKLANGHLDRDINDLTPWAYAQSCDTQAIGS